MISSIASIYRSFLKKPVTGLSNFLNKQGKKKKCYVCGGNLNHFLKYKDGSKNLSNFIRKLRMVGSDVDNFRCIYCGSIDRERHLFMFFDKLKLWEEIKKQRILHFAPEKILSEKIFALNPVEYIKADFNPSDKSIIKVDATNIPYPNDSFDIVICNHVLEHIKDYLKALGEIFRVLKPGGFAILQTPYSKIISNNFEEENIDTDDLRLFFYGEKDHLRVFSEKHFFSDLRKTGFTLEISKNIEFFNEKTSKYFGVNNEEDFIKVIKPQP